MQNGSETCGKRQIRGKVRLDIGSDLQAHSVFAYRNDIAANMVDHQDVGRLPSAEVLRRIKHDYKKSAYLDDDPIKSLGILKRSVPLGQNVIHKIGYDPFFIYFWSTHQIKIYNAKVREEGACLAIDATGKVTPKITHANNDKSKHLFLYTGILNCQTGPLPVIRQITECHDAASISDWLRKWLQTGAQYPREVVSVIICLTCSITT